MSIEIINYTESWADEMDKVLPEDAQTADADAAIWNLINPCTRTDNKGNRHIQQQGNKLHIRESPNKTTQIETPVKVVSPAPTPVTTTTTTTTSPVGQCDEECLISPVLTHHDIAFDEPKTRTGCGANKCHQQHQRRNEEAEEVVVASCSSWECAVMERLVWQFHLHFGTGMEIREARLKACEDVMEWANQEQGFRFDAKAIHAIQNQMGSHYLQEHYKVQLLLCRERQDNHNSVATNGARRVSKECFCGEHGGYLHHGLGCLWEMVGLCNGCGDFHHNCMLKRWDMVVEKGFASQLDIMCKVFMGLSTYEARTESIRRLLDWQSGKVKNVSRYISSNLNVKRGVRNVP